MVRLVTNREAPTAAAAAAPAPAQLKPLHVNQPADSHQEYSARFTSSMELERRAIMRAHQLAPQSPKVTGPSFNRQLGHQQSRQRRQLVRGLMEIRAPLEELARLSSRSLTHPSPIQLTSPGRPRHHLVEDQMRPASRQHRQQQRHVYSADFHQEYSVRLTCSPARQHRASTQKNTHGPRQQLEPKPASSNRAPRWSRQCQQERQSSPSNPG